MHGVSRNMIYVDLQIVGFPYPYLSNLYWRIFLPRSQRLATWDCHLTCHRRLSCWNPSSARDFGIFSALSSEYWPGYCSWCLGYCALLALLVMPLILIIHCSPISHEIPFSQCGFVDCHGTQAPRHPAPAWFQSLSPSWKHSGIPGSPVIPQRAASRWENSGSQYRLRR
jgi:hypothetical protein